MSEFTKSELQAKKVAELKEIAIPLGLEIKGLRKAELINAILQYYAASDKSEEVEDVVEVKHEALEPEPVQELVVEKIEEEKPVFKPRMIKLDKQTTIYKSPGSKEILGRIKGHVNVISEEGKYYKIRTFIFGKGSMYAYILK